LLKHGHEASGDPFPRTRAGTTSGWGSSEIEAIVFEGGADTDAAYKAFLHACVSRSTFVV
jgi:hypothetical protein